MIIVIFYLVAMEERLGWINLERIKAIKDKVQCKKHICFSKSETTNSETQINYFLFYFNSA